jgi:hypothetical protein
MLVSFGLVSTNQAETQISTGEVVWWASDGVSIFGVYELDNLKLADGMDFIANFYTNFFGVPGFKCYITPHFDDAEALKMLRMG